MSLHSKMLRLVAVLKLVHMIATLPVLVLVLCTVLNSVTRPSRDRDQAHAYAVRARAQALAVTVLGLVSTLSDKIEPRLVHVLRIMLVLAPNSERVKSQNTAMMTTLEIAWR